MIFTISIIYTIIQKKWFRLTLSIIGYFVFLFLWIVFIMFIGALKPEIEIGDSNFYSTEISINIIWFIDYFVFFSFRMCKSLISSFVNIESLIKYSAAFYRAEFLLTQINQVNRKNRKGEEGDI